MRAARIAMDSRGCRYSAHPIGDELMIEGYWCVRDRRARGRVAALRITHSACRPLRLAGPSSWRRTGEGHAMWEPGNDATGGVGDPRKIAVATPHCRRDG